MKQEEVLCSSDDAFFFLNEFAKTKECAMGCYNICLGFGFGVDILEYLRSNPYLVSGKSRYYCYWYEINNTILIFTPGIIYLD